MLINLELVKKVEKNWKGFYAEVCRESCLRDKTSLYCELQDPLTVRRDLQEHQTEAGASSAWHNVNASVDVSDDQQFSFFWLAVGIYADCDVLKQWFSNFFTSSAPKLTQIGPWTKAWSKHQYLLRDWRMLSFLVSACLI